MRDSPSRQIYNEIAKKFFPTTFPKEVMILSDEPYPTMPMCIQWEFGEKYPLNPLKIA
jgi:hypothetical protein